MNKSVKRVWMSMAPILILLAGTAHAQMGPGPKGHGPMAGMHPGGCSCMDAAGGAMHGGMMGRWWKDPAAAQKLNLTDAQTQQLEKIYQDQRLQAIDQRAALEKEQAKLQPLLEADHPEDGQVTAQIDKVAQARANLEKSQTLASLAMRRVLTPDQWKQLQSQPCMAMAGESGGPHVHGQQNAPKPPAR